MPFGNMCKVDFRVLYGWDRPQCSMFETVTVKQYLSGQTTEHHEYITAMDCKLRIGSAFKKVGSESEL
jgi:hypothetical protein